MNGFQEYLKLQKRLKTFRKRGLYSGSLTIPKPQIQRIVDRIAGQLQKVSSDQRKDLFFNMEAVFGAKSNSDRDKKLELQKKNIRAFKAEYKDIVKSTGLTGDKELIQAQKIKNSVKKNNQTIETLRQTILPLMVKAKKVVSTDVNTTDINEVKQKLKELRDQGDLIVNLKQSKPKLQQILSNYLINNYPDPGVVQQQGELPLEEIQVIPKMSKTKFHGIFRDVKLTTNPKMNDIRRFFTKIQGTLLDILKEQSSNGSFKMYYILRNKMFQSQNPFQTKKDKKFKSTERIKAKPVPGNSNVASLNEIMLELNETVIDLVQAFLENGSDWVIDSVEELEVRFAKFSSLQAGSYIELPVALQNPRNGLINIKNKDNKCWLYNNICYFHTPDRNRERVNNYKQYEHEFNLTGITFPMSFDQIPKWDRQNNTSSFVFSCEGGNLNTITPVYIDKYNQDCSNKVYHLILEQGDKRHFVLIKNPSAFFPYTKSSKAKQFLCPNCMNWFRSQELLDEHKSESHCLKNDCCKITMPPLRDHNGEKPSFKFTAFQKLNRLPFMFEFDIESDLVDIHDPNNSNLINQHIPNSVTGHFHSDFGDIETKVFYGQDCVVDFLGWMVTKESYIKEKMEQNKEMQMTDNDEASFKSAKECYLCKQPFPTGYNTDKALYKVRDHDHFTSKYRGACHASCNLNYNNRNFCVPVVAHNLKGYDSQLIIRDVAEFATEHRKFDCIPMNGEKFISFSLGKFRFIDSYAFMASSLDELVKNLKTTEIETGEKQFKHLESYYGHLGEDKLELLKQKGVYPYSYANGVNSFEIPCLPDKEWFYNDLTDTPISDKDYQRAQHVFETFECKTFQDYHDLYLITDVLLLADVFEAFRNLGLKNNGLDPAQFYGLPGHTVACCQKKMMEEGQEPIELLTDYEMFLMWEESKRGGLAQISHRYAKANNEYCPWYDSSKPKTWLTYFDMNSLYPSVISKWPLPHSRHRWANYTLDEILKLDPYGETGCLVECDIDYPEELHDLHNDYPCAVENVEGNFSPVMKNIADALDYKLPKNKKLIANLNNKRKYVCDYRNVQLYHSLGLKITKIHRVIEFKQTYSMKSYVDELRLCRQNAKNSFEKQYYKDMMNALFGKTIENERKYSSLEVCTDAKFAQKKINSFRCKSWNQYSENMVTVDLLKNSQKLQKPIFLGCTILELSKNLMLDFHYNVIKKRYGSKAKKLFTDTDSLCYLIETENVYDDMLEDYQHYDFSPYEKDSPITKKIEKLPENVQKEIKANKKAFCKMKDENGNDPMIEYCGRAPKEYSYEESSANLEKVKQQLNDLESETKNSDEMTDVDKLKYNQNKEELEQRINKLENNPFTMKGKGVSSHVLKSQCSHAEAVEMVMNLGDESKHTKENFNKKVEFKGFTTKDHTIYTTNMIKTGMSVLDSKRYVCADGINTLAWGSHRIPEI